MSAGEPATRQVRALDRGRLQGGPCLVMGCGSPGVLAAIGTAAVRGARIRAFSCVIAGSPGQRSARSTTLGSSFAPLASPCSAQPSERRALRIRGPVILRSAPEASVALPLPSV